MWPGLYLIYCLENHRFYVGESSNVVVRLGNHYQELTNQTLPCSALLGVNLGQEKFRFLVLDAGPQWNDLALRKKKEQEIIQLNLTRVYNQVDPRATARASERPVLRNGTLYAKSVAEASRKSLISPTHLCRHLINTNNTEWAYDNVEGDFVGHGSARPVSVNGEPFRSIRQAALRLKVDRKTLRKILDEERDPNIFWITKEDNSLDESS
jgi:hypothetical protein